MRLVIIILLIVVVFYILHYLFPVIQVCGDSMYPTYFDGEILIGTRIYKENNLEVGDIVLYDSPTEKGRTVIKRIDHFMNDHDGKLYIYCLGDNTGHSYDSRAYGYVSSKNIVCKVFDQRRNLNNVCD